MTTPAMISGVVPPSERASARRAMPTPMRATASTISHWMSTPTADRNQTTPASSTSPPAISVPRFDSIAHALGGNQVAVSVRAAVSVEGPRRADQVDHV